VKNNNLKDNADMRQKLVENYWLKKISGINTDDGLFAGLNGNRTPIESRDDLLSVAFEIEPPTARRIAEIAGSNEKIEYIVYLSFFGLLLHKYYKLTPVAVSSPGIKKGSLLLYRLNIDKNNSIKDVLQRTRDDVQESMDYRDFDFKRLKSLLERKNIDDTALYRFGVSDRRFDTDSSEFENVGLQLRFEEMAGDTYRGSVKFYPGLFEKEFVRQMVSHYRNLLSYVHKDLDKTVGELRYLSQPEKQQLLFEFNQTRAAYPENKTIHRLYEDRVKKDPHRIAVTLEDKYLNGSMHVTYRELNERANRAACFLREKGARPGDIIGLLLTPSIEMITGILGVLKSGAAYLPIDPGYPEKRIDYMLTDSKTAIVLSSEDIEMSLNNRSYKTYRPYLPGDPGDLAYIIYTSGTTGRPKGVMIEHRDVVRLMVNRKHPFDFNSGDTWTMFHSYCFDFSVWEMYGALLYGGKLILMPREIVQTPGVFSKLLEYRQVTVLNQIPSIFYNLAAELLKSEVKKPLSLRYVIFGGDVLKPALLEKWYERYPEVKLVNMYGITETTVHVTYKEIGRREIETGENNIGSPIPTLSCYIMDNELNPEPMGIEGEIVVGGEGVGRGYLNRVELTHERFIANPHVPGERLYRSGDSGRRPPRLHGDIEFLGRIDNQVKIRGFRIELGEIEKHLSGHGQIKETVVVAPGDSTGEKHIRAYFVPHDADAAVPASAELREYLSHRVPDYMIPAFFIPLKRFPLTPTGKINRNALPEPETGGVPGTVHEAPRNQTEAALVKIWQEVLGIETIGINDNFFNMGGNSIKGIHVANKIQEWLEEIVHVTVLFEAPTVKELAKKLDTYKTGAGSRIDGAKVAAIRQIIKPPAPPRVSSATAPKNPPAVFILSPPRCGSTLLRVILAGHPGLFAPPELELLGFDTLRDRKRQLSGRFGYVSEGTVRALMEINNCGPGEAQSIMTEFEEKGMTTREFYGVMQERLGNRLLVDKTPFYTLDLKILERAEDYFKDPLYIHLVRSPYAAIHSFEEAKLDQVFRYEHNFSARELAELVWLISNQNILEFFKTIPGNRTLTVKFENLVRDTGPIVRRMCDFLGIEYREEMIRVYENTQSKMTDGIHPESKMLGDIKFFDHSGIEPRVIDRWKDNYKTGFLGDITLELAKSLGYGDERAGVDYARMEPAPVSEYYRLSHAQKRLWILHQFEENHTAYNIPAAYLCEGDLNRQILGRAFDTVILRHESLRTIFVTVGGEPRQKILAPGYSGFRLEYIDLRAKPRDREQVEKRILEEAGAAFDLEKGPLLRAKCIHLEQNKYVLLFTVHHIICDGWSVRLLIEELLTLYNAFAQGKEDPPAPLPFQYKDYSEWQNGPGGKESMKQQAAYWLKEFNQPPPPLELPTDHPRPRVRGFEGNTVNAVLTPGETEGLKNLALREGVTLYMLLLALYAVFLSKICGGQEDIVVGTGIAGRRHPGLRKMIGMFFNTLALRCGPGGEKSFNTFLEEVKKRTLAAFENQDYPFEELVENVVETRDQSRSPLIEAVFLLQNMELEPGDVTDTNIPGLEIEPYGSTAGISKFDLSLYCKEIGDTLNLTFEYRTALFKEETVLRFISYFREIAASAAAAPGQKIAQMEIVPGEEKKRLLVDFNNTETPYPQDKTIHRLFEEQVEKTPGVIAVSSPSLDEEHTDMFTPGACFKKNPYLFEAGDPFFYGPPHARGKTGIAFKFLKTHNHNSVVVDDNMWKLLALFDGERDTGSIFSALGDPGDIAFALYTPGTMDILGITHDFNCKPHLFSNMNWDDFVSLVKLLYDHFLIELISTGSRGSRGTGTKKEIPGDFSPNPSVLFQKRPVLKDLLWPGEVKKLPAADVLLLGDTPGMPTTGLVYMAAFLRRNGVKALCRFYDDAGDSRSMKKELRELLQTVRPGIVAVSLKWFLYIARVLDMCRAVREYSRETGLPIKIVVGGNTASYYWDRIITEDSIDYVIRGDGELPLLGISRGEGEPGIPNCVYKKDGEIFQNPVTCINGEPGSPDIYLSHLDEILFPGRASLFGTFFIHTHLGCGMNCFYCGGCRRAQQKTFNRKTVFVRPAADVRKDIVAARPYTSTFQFDFDVPGRPGELVNYCREIWQGIELSHHFVSISILRLPPAPLVKLAAETFKYVYWDIDILTLSERHRMQLFSRGMVKPQPTNTEILGLLGTCDRYENVEVRLNAITGLPCFLPEDIGRGDTFLAAVTTAHPSFSELHWARLHAQPGAPIVETAETYAMHSFAVTFDDFLEYSKKNVNSGSVHQRLEHLNYPYVYFDDDGLNSRITLHYTETDRKIQKYRENRRLHRVPPETLTYRQLNDRAGQLARDLASRGTVPGSIVALLTEPSVDMAVAVMGVLKAGGAYLPIDPGTPEERINYMLKDSNAKILIKDVGNRLACSTTAPRPPRPSRPSNLAYVIYTSGSTGRPKGVLLEHRNVHNLLLGLKRGVYSRYENSGTLNVALLAPYVFDASVKQIFGALLQGHSLHIVTEGIRKDGKKLVEFYTKNKIDISDGTPSLLGLLRENGMGTVKEFLIGGEELRREAVEHLLNAPGGAAAVFTNLYGPTECCVDSTSYTLTKENMPSGPGSGVPIGKPMANVQVRILGSENRLQPIGCVGEICIGGHGVARGYLNNPELTAERFYRSNRSYKTYIFYKTGDLGCWMPDGNLRFTGRVDHQVKIRGFRIEPGEIEQQLLAHPRVRQAVVVAGDDSNGNKTLCAYFVPEDRYRLSKEEKTRYMRQLLLDGWGVHAQEKIKRTTVFVAGAGGIGSAVLQQLALVGMGTVIVCDYDVVELSNLNRQIMHDESRIGMNKALSAQKTIRRINPNVNVVPYRQKITRENIDELVGNAAVIFDCVDDLETKFVLSECAVKNRIPHMLSAMIEISAYAAVLHSPFTPCFHCLHDHTKLDEIREFKEVDEGYRKNPFPVVSPALYVTTGFVCNEALKILLGQENPAYNKFFLFNQKGSGHIVNTTGYKQMTYSFNRHFRNISREQGFDWEQCWRGNFLEELSIRPDPGCPVCGRTKQERTRSRENLDIPIETGDAEKELRTYLLSRLPDYMVPSYFVQLEELPLTPNGKVDRKSLPGPETRGTPGEDTPPRTPPADEFEEKLTRLWSELLGIEEEKIGTGSNFFALGGNSLSLITLISKIYKEFGTEVSITRIFTDPTIKDIAQYIKSNRNIEYPLVVFNKPSALSAPPTGNLFCFPPAVPFGIAYEELAAVINDYSFYSFNFIEEEDRLKKYVDIITNIQPAGPYILFGWSAAGGLIFQVAGALEEHGREVSDLILADTFLPGPRARELGQRDREYIGNIEKWLVDNRMEFLKKEVTEKMENYMKFNFSLTTLQKVRANVHLIFSEQKDESKKTGWDKFTGGSLVIYNGFGKHDEMFEPGYLEKNASLIRDILSKIVSKK